MSAMGPKELGLMARRVNRMRRVGVAFGIALVVGTNLLMLALLVGAVMLGVYLAGQV